MPRAAKTLPPTQRRRESTDDRHWHVDRKVPIALLIGIVAQTFALGWWASGVEYRVDTVQKADTATQIKLVSIEARQLDAEKLGVRIDEQLKAMRETMTRIESSLKPKP